jgi:hypothetical protein
LNLRRFLQESEQEPATPVAVFEQGATGAGVDHACLQSDPKDLAGLDG